MRKILFSIFCAIPLALSSLQASESVRKAFDDLSDILQLLPAFSATYALAKEDYEGLKELAIGFSATMGVTYTFKLSLNALAKKYPTQLAFAQRPNNGSFDGFPSGHTASAFSAAGFMQKRYGWKWGLPTFLLATLTGVSRVLAEKHTPFQVVAGAMIGFSINYLVSSKYIDPTKERIALNRTTDIRDRSVYRISYTRAF